jgi:hypothetical protein
MKVSKVFFSRHNGGITIVKDKKHLTVSKDHTNFEAIKKVLETGEYDKLDALVTNTATLINAIGTVRDKVRVFVKNNKVMWKDARGKEAELVGTLVDRIRDVITKPQSKIMAESLMALMDNLTRNKHKDIREELWDWLKSGNARTPITRDGCFLAFKSVRSDYFDHHSGKFNNSPGNRVSMPEDEVNTNRDETCSRGLHFCSYDYLNMYGGSGRTIIVKVNPRHVMAIPRDYGFQKGRASEYLVVGDMKPGLELDQVFADCFIDDKTKETAAPGVDFVPNIMKISLEARAEMLNLVHEKKVFVYKDEDGEYVVVEGDEEGYTGFVPKGVDCYEMSFETKSIRAAVKAAVEVIDAEAESEA